MGRGQGPHLRRESTGRVFSSKPGPFCSRKEPRRELPVHTSHLLTLMIRAMSQHWALLPLRPRGPFCPGGLAAPAKPTALPQLPWKEFRGDLAGSPLQAPGRLAAVRKQLYGAGGERWAGSQTPVTGHPSPGAQGALMASGHPLHWWEGTCIPAVAQTASCDPRPLPISSARPWPWALRLPAGEALGQPPGLLPPQNWLKSPLPPQGVLLLWEVQTALAPGGLTPHWLSQERSRWDPYPCAVPASPGTQPHS